MSDTIPIDNQIHQFIHCPDCLAAWLEGPKDKAPEESEQLTFGYSRIGLQVWCRVHNRNVIHIDFDGMKLPSSRAYQDEQGRIIERKKG